MHRYPELITALSVIMHRYPELITALSGIMHHYPELITMLLTLGWGQKNFYKTENLPVFERIL